MGLAAAAPAARSSCAQRELPDRVASALTRPCLPRLCFSREQGDYLFRAPRFFET